MKIAMIHPSLWGRGGAERQLLRLATELQKMGHHVELFTDAVDENCYPELRKQLTINVVPHPFWRIHQGIGWQAVSSMIRHENAGEKPASKLKRIMRKALLRNYYVQELPLMLNIGRSIPRSFDVINNHNFPSEWAAFVAKRKLKVPIVWMNNGPAAWFMNPSSRGTIGTAYWPLFECFDRTSVDYIDRITVISRMAANDVRKAYSRSSEIVRSGVDVDFFHRVSGKRFRETHGLQNSFVLLQVGNIGLVRGNVNSIKVLSLLACHHDNVKLVFDGYASETQIRSLMALAEKLKVKDKLLVLHTRKDSELAEVYAACDVFIYPSHLTWSLAVSEAMAAEKPVIVPKDCGISEIIQSGVNGIIVNGDNPEEIAQRIETLMQNPEFCRRLGTNAYEYVRDHLTWRQYAKNMEDVFEKATTEVRKN